MGRSLTWAAPPGIWHIFLQRLVSLNLFKRVWILSLSPSLPPSLVCGHFYQDASLHAGHGADISCRLLHTKPLEHFCSLWYNCVQLNIYISFLYKIDVFVKTLFVFQHGVIPFHIFLTPYPRDLQPIRTRIWPFCDFLGVLSDHVVLPKDEERPVDGEAVLPDWDGVVQGHGACALRFGLLEGWGDATCGHGRPIAAADAVGASIPRALQARDIVPESGHSV